MLNGLPVLSHLILTRPVGGKPVPWVLFCKEENGVKQDPEHGHVTEHP